MLGGKGWKKLRSINVKKFREVDRRTFKIALLGSSGTDTKEVATSLRTLYNKKNVDSEPDEEDNDDVDHASYKNLVRHNAYQSIRAIVDAVCDKKSDITNSDTLKFVSNILKYEDSDPSAIVPREIWMCFKQIWSDENFKELAEKTAKSNQLKEAEYYFNSIDRLSSGTFEPSAHDVAMSRAKMNGIVKSHLRKNLWLFEVAQITSIHTALKVLQFFDSKTVVIFCVNIMLYNQYESDGETNKLSRAVQQYQEVAKNKNTADSLMILLFTNTDVFQTNLEQFNIHDYFPDFNGKSNSKDACKFIMTMFNEQKQKNCLKTLFTTGDALSSSDDRSRVKLAINECAISFQIKEIQF